MKSWVLVLIANEQYISRALETIIQARTVGKWTDPIVLLHEYSIVFSNHILKVLEQLQISTVKLPNRNVSKVREIWQDKQEHENYSYIMSRPFIYQKFNMFHIFFKQWDVVFYLDAGCQIQGDLNRMKTTAEPDNIVYAHSDAYPTYEWKLERQFCLDIAPHEMIKELKSNYKLDCDYFQTTLMIFDTKIIQEDTVERLFELAEKYPVSFRMDQGIINLYFLCERKLWKQLPLHDEQGFLYDFHEREGCLRKQYLILKYPRQQL
jgi:hypothetical protein